MRGFAMSTPLPKQVEIEFYYVIGGIVIRYGFIDAFVAAFMKTLFEDLGGHSSQKKAVRPMATRLAYINKCFRNKAELAHLTGDAENITSSIANLDALRAYLIHGWLTEYYPAQSAFQFTKIDPNHDRSGYVLNTAVFTYARLNEMAQLCTDVVRDLEAFGKALDAVSSARQNKQQS
jgi:hypothetical protein